MREYLCLRCASTCIADQVQQAYQAETMVSMKMSDKYVFDCQRIDACNDCLPAGSFSAVHQESLVRQSESYRGDIASASWGT